MCASPFLVKAAEMRLIAGLFSGVRSLRYLQDIFRPKKKNIQKVKPQLAAVMDEVGDASRNNHQESGFLLFRPSSHLCGMCFP
jgi:hypothetical protein